MSNIGFSGVSNIVPPQANMVVSNNINIGNDETINGDLDITKYMGGLSTGTLSTGNTTFNLINTNATTVNFAGDATTINIGSVNGTIAFNGTITIQTKKSGTYSQVNSNGVYVIPPDDPNGLVATVTPSSGTVLTLIDAGTAADCGGSNSAVRLGPSRLLTVNSAAGDNGDFIDFVGTDQNGVAQSETLTLAEGGTTYTQTTNYWSSITSATFRTAGGTGSASSAIQIGWVSSTVTGFYTMGFKDSGVHVVDVVDSNVVHSLILQSSTAVNFRQWGFTMTLAIDNTGTNDEWITTAAADKIFGVSATAVAVGTSNYAAVTSPGSGAIVYTPPSDVIKMDCVPAGTSAKIGLGAWLQIKAAYNLTSTDNTAFYVQSYTPANGFNNAGTSVFG